MSEIILPETKIDKGQWVAFVHQTTKSVFGITEFKLGGKANTSLIVVMKPTEAQLKTELKRLKYTLPT